VDVDHGSPVAIHERLIELVTRVIGVVMKSLHQSTWLVADEHFVSLSHVRESLDKQQPLVSIEQSLSLDLHELINLFDVWAINKDFLDEYDVFFSYRWTTKETAQLFPQHTDSPLVPAIHDKLRGYNVTPSKRIIIAFKQRLSSLCKIAIALKPLIPLCFST
jgi:hypothetical protein